MTAERVAGSDRARASEIHGARLLTVLRRPEGVAILAGAAFALLAVVGMLWPFGGDAQPEAFWNPDETVNRLAAARIAATGSPAVELPFADPEDLLHMRFWYSEGDEARPAYPPLAYYLHGAAMKLGPLGPWVPLLPAALGVGALAAVGALTLRRRPWLGALLPLAVFPLTYWLLRPWHSSGLAAAWIAVAALLLVLWSRSQRGPYFLAATACLAVAGAIRPDQLFYLFGALWFVALLVDRESWRRITLTLVVAGLGSLFLVALFNWAVVGDPLRSGYQAYASQPLPLEQGDGALRNRLPFPLQEAAFALAPWGFRFDAGFAGSLLRYWVLLGPIALLTLLGLAGFAMLARSRPSVAGLFFALGALVAVYVASRYCTGCFGGTATWGSLEHSLLRYVAVVYLLFGVAALLLIERARWGRVQRWAAPLWVGLVLVGGFWLAVNVGAQRQFVADEQAELRAVSAALPEGTVVYMQYGGWALTLDPSLVAARVPPGFREERGAAEDAPAPVVPVAEYERLVSSILRARDAGHDVAVRAIDPEHAAILDAHLRSRGLRLQALPDLHLAWMVEPLTAPARDAARPKRARCAGLPRALRWPASRATLACLARYASCPITGEA